MTERDRPRGEMPRGRFAVCAEEFGSHSHKPVHSARTSRGSRKLLVLCDRERKYYHNRFDAAGQRNREREHAGCIS
jgi:hypothetical protein